MDHKQTDRQAAKIADFLHTERVKIETICTVLNSVHADVSYTVVRGYSEIHRIYDGENVAPSSFVWGIPK